jgi:diacylglycerol kinase (ATP)
MKSTFSFRSVAIIYNPNSTGSSEDYARELAKKLEASTLSVPVTVIATDHAGHAEELAHDLACTEPDTLIVSSSGDGGYHEVVNGVMRARAEGHQASTGLLPAGNANDHWNNVNQGGMAQAIIAGDRRHIELLHISVTSKNWSWERYAHSYAGIGMTPSIGRELNKTKLNRLNEAWIVLRSLMQLRPVKILVNDKTIRYDSLIFSNVERMSKVLKLSEESEVVDGKFEITAIRTRNKLHLIGELLRTVTMGSRAPTQATNFTFKTVKAIAIQLDGEIRRLPSDATVVVSVIPNALWCVV